MTEQHHRGFTLKTVGGAKGYHSRDIVAGLRVRKIVPHCARKLLQQTLHLRLTST